MRIIAWGFFGLYSTCLLVSAFPILARNIGVGLFLIAYIVLAQFLSAYLTTRRGKGFWLSNALHLIPIGIFIYIVVGRAMIASGFRIDPSQLGTAIAFSMSPLFLVVLQYALLRRIQRPVSETPSSEVSSSE